MVESPGVPWAWLCCLPTGHTLPGQGSGVPRGVRPMGKGLGCLWGLLWTSWTLVRLRGDVLPGLRHC